MTKEPIPAAALEQHTAILGKTGSGKTSTSKLLVEQVVAAGARVCVLDTIKSDWWGITSSADGKRPGLPFQILGGPRGHVPLPSSAGRAVAEIVANGSLPLSIIDMADFEPGGIQKFFVDFAPTLLRKMRGVVYLVVEEAHEIAPKERAGFGAENMAIHWAKKLATAGRSKGIRLVVATQRTQSLHNAVLGSCETVIVHRLTTPADQGPVLAWLKANSTKAVLQQVESSLSSLKTGTAWLCSGEAQIFEKVAFPRIKTYDNTATPTGDGGEQLVKMAPVDQDKLRAIIGEAVKEAEANDPKVLKARVADLSRKLAAQQPAPTTTKAVPESDDQVLRRPAVKQAIATAAAEAEQRGAARAHKTIVQRIKQGLGRIISGAAVTAIDEIAGEVQPAEPIQGARSALLATTTTGRALERIAQTRPASNGHDGDRQLRAERKPLAVLVAALPGGMTEAQWATMAELKRTGGTWSTYKSRLRVAGMIEERGNLFYATQAAADEIGAERPALDTPEQRIAAWKKAVGGGAAKLLDILIDRHPRWMSKAELAAVAQLEPTGGTFSTYVSRLSSNELVEKQGDELKASDTLLME